MNNCLTYALDQWLHHGGYVKMRKSLAAKQHGVGPFHPLHLVPHFLHESAEGMVTQMVPTQSEVARAIRKGPWYEWIMLWNFTGQVQEGDEHYLTAIPEDKRSNS